MTDQEKLELLRRTISDEVAQLEAWADESLAGGWSTHQVGPQRKRARDLTHVLWEAGP